MTKRDRSGSVAVADTAMTAFVGLAVGIAALAAYVVTEQWLWTIGAAALAAVLSIPLFAFWTLGVKLLDNVSDVRQQQAMLLAAQHGSPGSSQS